MHRHASVNRIYRLVWSDASSSWVPAAESTRGRGKGSCKALLMATLSLCAGLTEAGPLGGQVVSGSGHIGQSGALTTITQASPVLSLSWASFNIAPQETVDFVQPSASAIAVNRITGSNGTQILGHLNANGQVYLINPNGIVFGRGSQVNVGGLVASTLDVTDASLAGNSRTFSGAGSGSVQNEGTINAAGDGTGGGYVALLGNHVVNQGSIRAQLGTVAMGAGNAATLTFQGDSLVHLQVDRSVLNSLAANGGLIRADGGQVLMSAGAADALLASVVNNTGVIEARTVQEHAGGITLLGGMAEGTVQIAGTLDASAPDGGNGGFIETSAAHVEVANSAKITTLAAHGLTGSWLIDPQDFTVAASGGDISGAVLSGNLATTDVTLQSSAGGTAGSGNVNIDDPVSWSANTTLTLSGSNNVNVNASITASGNTAGLGIRANDANGNESASGPGIFTLNNGASINLPGTNPSLSIAGASFIVVNSLGAPGDATTAPGTPTLQGLAVTANLTGHYALGGNIDASPTSTWNGGAGFTPIGNSANAFTGVFDGLGHTISNLVINTPLVNDVGLFGMAGGNSALRNVGLIGGSVTGMDNVGGLAGWNQGPISNSYATSAVTGHVNVGGLAGANSSSIAYAYAGGIVTGSNYVGGLVGVNMSSIANSYANGNVSGGGSIGGLVGYNHAGIGNSYATGDVVGSVNVGGLVGTNGNGGSVTNAYATGSVSGSSNVGGLVGSNYGGISVAYSTGPVSGTTNVGGLVGQNPAGTGTVTNGYWNTTTSDQTTSAQPDGTYSGLGGLSTLQMQNSAYFAGFNFSTTAGAGGNSWVMVDEDGGFNSAGGFVAGQHYDSVPGATFPMLTSEYSTVIVNAHQLQLMVLAPSASYTLAANIDASATARGGAIGGDVWSSAGGFFPIGTGGNGPFTGTFDGLGHTISNLTMAWPAQLAYIGLIGNAQSGSIIKNVGLIDASVTEIGVAVNCCAYGVGALVGLNQGTVSNSYATGTVSGSSYVGGLVGSNYGLSGFGVISNSHAAVTVSGVSKVGGLAGGSNYGASITNSYATGNVSGISIVDVNGSGSGSSMVGGLVGLNKASIANSYATGNVRVNLSDGTTADRVGGLVGYNFGSIANSYATGNVNVSDGMGAGGVGGLVGNNYGSVANSFWNSDVIGIGVGANGGGSGTFTGGGGLTGGEMHTMSNFAGAGWSISNTGGGDVWQIYEGSTAPLLSSFLTPLTVTASNASSVFNGVGFSGNGVTYSVTPNGNLLGTLSYGHAQGAVGAGSYAITPTGLYSTQQGYSITAISATLTISPLTLTGTVAAGNSVYGAPLTPGAVTFSNLVTGYTAVTSPVTVTTAGNLSGGGKLKVGTYAGVESAGSALTGGDAGNYTFAGAINNYSVTPRALSGAIADGNSVYGAALTPGAMNFSNAIVGDAVAAVGTVTVNTAGHTSASGNFTAGSHLGSESVGGMLSGADASNYTFAGATGNYTVTPLALTGSIATGSSVYGSALSPGAATLTGEVGNDVLGTVTVTVNTMGLTSTSGNLTAGGHSGVEAVTALSGTDGANYSFASPSGSYRVTPLALTGSIATGGSIYGSALTPGAVSLSNAIGGDSVTAGAVTVNTTNHTSTSGHFTAGTHMGSETVGNTLSGADAGDYTFTGATGDYTVTPLTVTVAAIGANKIYDGTTYDLPALSGGGVLFGDQVRLAAGTANFASKNVGGAQPVTVSGITMGGADAADYGLNSTSATTTAAISPASLGVGGVAAADKVYDGTTAAILAGGGLVGVVAGDTGLVALIDAGRFVSANAGTGIAVAAAETLSGAGAGNYVLTQPIGLVANITPATLTYDATPASRTAGQSPTGLSGSVSGFVAGETPANAAAGTLAWTTPANAASRAGQYAIDGSGLTAANYVFVEASGNANALTLQPVAVPPIPTPPPVPTPPPAPWPPVVSAPTLPPGGSQCHRGIAGNGAGIPGRIACSTRPPVTLIAAQGTDDGSPSSSGPVADTTRMIGTTDVSLRIVSGGVRLPR
jgi:filamentous hemagglutinin family protein